MKQMMNSSAPAVERIYFGSLSEGFFRKARDNGKIFYLGEDTILTGVGVWPVFENGLISGCGVDFPHDHEEVEVIEARDLGITEIKWAEDAFAKN